MSPVTMAESSKLRPQNYTHSQDIQTHGSDMTGNTPDSKNTNRHSPVAPLAPLEYLQNQRRGSITDPSLHATPNSHPNSSRSTHSSSPSQPFRHHILSASNSQTSHDPNNKNPSSEPRPASPYIFGDATAHSAHRQLVRTPSDERGGSRTPGEATQQLHEQTRMSGSSHAGNTNETDQMNVDSHQVQSSNRNVQQFDYNMRRHSVAVGHDQHAPRGSQVPHGTKRKMSSDRDGEFAAVGEIDPQLVGPGVASNLDADAPAPKRRGSAIDTQKIESLSLYDRRNSTDSRGGSTTGQWWVNDRTPGMFSTIHGVGGYPSGFSENRNPSSVATFAWPSNAQPSEQTMESEPDTSMAGPPRPFDPSLSQMGMMHPITFAQDRRISGPENVTPNAPSAGPTRVLRSRSRPPSRQIVNADGDGQSSGSNAGQDEPTSDPSPSAKASNKDSGATPYSRSPELRVSHKLAERKRRKEMKDLFDELRDQLPADRGMKASKWEILSKAIDFVTQLKQGQQEMAREIDVLRHELEAIRQGNIPTFGPSGPHAVVYGQGPPVVPGQYPAPPPGTITQHPSQPHHQSQISRPSSSQNTFPPGGGPSATPPVQNGNVNVNRADAPPT